MAHTPTPWHWNTHHQLPGKTECLLGVGFGKSVLTWGRCPNHEGVEYTYLYISEDDAAFIIQACNNHERLQKVVNALLAAYHAPTKLRDGEEQTMRERLVDEVYELVAAIAQAEGRIQKEPYEKPAIRVGTPKETEKDGAV